MKKTGYNFYFFILAAIIFVIFAFDGNAEALPYRSYTYDFWGEAVPSPPPYLPSRIIDGTALGVGEFNEPRDMYVCEQTEEIFLLDSGNDRLLRMDYDWQLLGIIDEFENRGNTDTFDNPRGVFADPDAIYIADRNHARVLKFSRAGELMLEIGSPEADVEGVITEDFRFRPRKVAADQAGRIYVISDEVYDGIMEFDQEGNFQGFIGAPRVAPSIIDYMWYRLATREQRERMSLFLPVEHSNLDIDERGFIYATVSGGAIRSEEVVRKLNPSGEDVLRRMGFHPPVGDYGSALRDRHGNLVLPSSLFVDVAAREHGTYSVLDRRRGRIFTYDMNGNLLYVFGGRGGQKGLARIPVALETRGEDILVLDSRSRRITVYEPTTYGTLIHGAIEHYNTGNYDRSVEMWNEVLRLNLNYDLAYTGIARSQLRQDQFQEAMKNYRIGQNRQGYSEAFALYRREVLAENFGNIIGGIVLFLLFILACKRYSLKSRISEILSSPQKTTAVSAGSADAAEGVAQAYSTRFEEGVSLREIIQALGFTVHLVFHPFGGFWDLKNERKGNLPAAVILLGLLTLTYVFMRQYTGFIFNPRDLTELNILTELASVIIPFVLWCVVNWSLTTLMEGKGTIGEIFMYTAFAFSPIILVNIPVTVISNFITLDEGAFFYFFITMSAIWAGALLFFGTMVIHDYDMPKTLLTVFMVLFSMGIMLFIGLLLFNLVDQVVAFVTDIYSELVFRM